MFVCRSSHTLLPQLLLLLALGLPAAARTITDGDTIKHNGRAYRLWRIDAPLRPHRRDLPSIRRGHRRDHGARGNGLGVRALQWRLMSIKKRRRRPSSSACTPTAASRRGSGGRSSAKPSSSAPSRAGQLVMCSAIRRGHYCLDALAASIWWNETNDQAARITEMRALYGRIGCPNYPFLRHGDPFASLYGQPVTWAHLIRGCNHSACRSANHRPWRNSAATSVQSWSEQHEISVPGCFQ